MIGPLIQATKVLGSSVAANIASVVMGASTAVLTGIEYCRFRKESQDSDKPKASGIDDNSNTVDN